MIDRRDAMQGFLAAMATLALPVGSAEAHTEIDEATARAALDPWADALASNNPAAVEKVLAPEYQIVRSDGTGYSKTEYLTVLPTQNARSRFRDIVATGNHDLMVLRYVIETDQTIADQPVQAISPRLSVFRKEGEGWLLVAHASFAKIG
ncbi:MAG: nuclear transport factor 2 family protein [Rhodospirillaceae bacterium]|nr:nuclear transport factor 2 family protein [Rhodospirillaceae bacterium]